MKILLSYYLVQELLACAISANTKKFNELKK